MYFSTFQPYNDEQKNKDLDLDLNLKLDTKLDTKLDLDLYTKLNSNSNANAILVEDKICLICLDNTGNIVSLISLMKYSKLCSCDGKFHLKCLKIWIDKSSGCPICRKKINTELLPINMTMSNREYYIYYFLYGIRMCSSLSMILIVYLAIFFICKIIMSGISEPNLFN